MSKLYYTRPCIDYKTLSNIATVHFKLDICNSLYYNLFYCCFYPVCFTSKYNIYNIQNTTLFRFHHKELERSSGLQICWTYGKPFALPCCV